MKGVSQAATRNGDRSTGQTQRHARCRTVHDFTFSKDAVSTLITHSMSIVGVAGAAGACAGTRHTVHQPRQAAGAWGATCRGVGTHPRLSRAEVHGDSAQSGGDAAKDEEGGEGVGHRVRHNTRPACLHHGSACLRSPRQSGTPWSLCCGPPSSATATASFALIRRTMRTSRVRARLSRWHLL